MDGKKIKYLFYVLAGLLVIWMIKGGVDAGMSGDEPLHYTQSVSVYNYFASLGKDTAALDTPYTHLKYYGQSFDNLTTILIKWFHVEDVYLFRHIACSFVGWLAIVITAFFAIWLAGYQAGIWALVLFALSPTFMGHAQNNLKDIPFALSYISALFFTQRFLFLKGPANRWNLLLLTLSIAFSISIRPGGILLICYLFFFLFFYLLRCYIADRKQFTIIWRKKLIQSLSISFLAGLFGILLWPYAQQNPIVNGWESYQIMAHFPTTIQQLFEGHMQWSDLMPWYYLPKYMMITIPVVLFVGCAFFVVRFRKIINAENALKYGFILFSILFPVFFVLYEHSNLYGSWRHFLFIYPSIVLLAAIGFALFFKSATLKYLRLAVLLVVLFLSAHPILFMVQNHPYYYLYYNQLIGGLKGAYGNYETDYYYHTMREGSEWLTNYLKENPQKAWLDTDARAQMVQDPGQMVPLVKIAGNFSIDWYFRDRPDIQTLYCRYGERSQADWDYMIVANSYIPPSQLKDGIWPPKNAIHIIYTDKMPVCAVLKRETKLDLLGYEALIRGDTAQSVRLFEETVKADYGDEIIFYNFAQALLKVGKWDRAQSQLQKALEHNPGCEPVLMCLGNLATKQNQTDMAIVYYETLIGYNRKYFEAYVALSRLFFDQNINKGRDLLRACLTLNPKYRPAIKALADSYRDSEPEVAKKYDELFNSY